MASESKRPVAGNSVSMPISVASISKVCATTSTSLRTSIGLLSGPALELIAGFFAQAGRSGNTKRVGEHCGRASGLNGFQRIVPLRMSLSGDALDTYDGRYHFR